MTGKGKRQPTLIDQIILYEQITKVITLTYINYSRINQLITILVLIYFHAIRHLDDISVKIVTKEASFQRRD